MVRQLREAVFSSSEILTDGEESFILSFYKGEGEALDLGNYRVLKLTDQVMKPLEWVLDFYINKMVNIGEMQFGFVPGRGTTDAMIIVCHLEEKHITTNKLLYTAFVDPGKAFDWAPWKGSWWALRSLSVYEWPVCVIQGMYSNIRSRMWINGQYSKESGLHQALALSLLLFILVLEALSREFRTGVFMGVSLC